jgi:hypothetical protein
MYEYIGILLGARPNLHISRLKVKLLLRMKRIARIIQNNSIPPKL